MSTISYTHNVIILTLSSHPMLRRQHLGGPRGVGSEHGVESVDVLDLQPRGPLYLLRPRIAFILVWRSELIPLFPDQDLERERRDFGRSLNSKAMMQSNLKLLQGFSSSEWEAQFQPVQYVLRLMYLYINTLQKVLSIIFVSYEHL